MKKAYFFLWFLAMPLLLTSCIALPHASIGRAGNLESDTFPKGFLEGTKEIFVFPVLANSTGVNALSPMSSSNSSIVYSLGEPFIVKANELKKVKGNIPRGMEFGGTALFPLNFSGLNIQAGKFCAGAYFISETGRMVFLHNNIKSYLVLVGRDWYHKSKILGSVTAENKGELLDLLDGKSSLTTGLWKKFSRKGAPKTEFALEESEKDSLKNFILALPIIAGSQRDYSEIPEKFRQCSKDRDCISVGGMNCDGCSCGVSIHQKYADEYASLQKDSCVRTFPFTRDCDIHCPPMVEQCLNQLCALAVDKSRAAVVVTMDESIDIAKAYADENDIDLSDYVFSSVRRFPRTDGFGGEEYRVEWRHQVKKDQESKVTIWVTGDRVAYLKRPSEV